MVVVVVRAVCSSENPRNVATQGCACRGALHHAADEQSKVRLSMLDQSVVK